MRLKMLILFPQALSLQLCPERSGIKQDSALQGKSLYQQPSLSTSVKRIRPDPGVGRKWGRCWSKSTNSEFKFQGSDKQHGDYGLTTCIVHLKVAMRVGLKCSCHIKQIANYVKWRMSTNFTGVNMSQYIHVSNHPNVHLKLTWCCISIKLGGKDLIMSKPTFIRTLLLAVHC